MSSSSFSSSEARFERLLRPAPRSREELLRLLPLLVPSSKKLKIFPLKKEEVGTLELGSIHDIQLLDYLIKFPMESTNTASSLILFLPLPPERTSRRSLPSWCRRWRSSRPRRSGCPGGSCGGGGCGGGCLLPLGGGLCGLFRSTHLLHLPQDARLQLVQVAGQASQGPKEWTN